MPALIWSPDAIADLSRLSEWAHSVDPTLSLPVVRAIRQRVLILRDFPRVGEPLDADCRKLSERRYGYVVLYRLRGSAVEILRIRHTREDWR